MDRLAQSACSSLAVAVLLVSAGCTSLGEYVHNGFKVGPNYCKPDASVAEHWIDESDIRVRDGEDLSRWWTVFNDPKLNYLIQCAYRQNLTLREAGFRVLEARALLAVARGEFFPQSQTMSGGYSRNAGGGNPPPFTPPSYSDSWDYGFGLRWELDFWGRLRRAIAQADDNLDASVEDYDDVLVTLLGDVATNYVNIRTYQERIELLKSNVTLQKGVLDYIESRYNAGFKVSELDLDQAVSGLRQTEAAIPQLEITLRQFQNAVCVLLGMPPRDIEELLGSGPIPTAASEVVIGIPAELLRRRPDIRAAERRVAAQAEQIGIAQADLYPLFTLDGSLGFQAKTFGALFSQSAFNGSFGPSFNWMILNYGRIINNVRFEDAVFQQLVATYQQTVLTANQEVENGLVSFLRSQQRAKLLDQSVEAAEKAVKIVILQYKVGSVDFNRYATIEQNLVTQQDTDATSRGNIALGLISVYTALGGGWEIRLRNEELAPPFEAPAAVPGAGKPGEDQVPAPAEGTAPTTELIPRPPAELSQPHEDVTVPAEELPEPPQLVPQVTPSPPQPKASAEPRIEP